MTGRLLCRLGLHNRAVLHCCDEIKDLLSEGWPCPTNYTCTRCGVLMTIGRIGDQVYDPTTIRCEGCAQTTLMCECCMDHDAGTRCCTVCTHVHPPATLARYGMLNK